jgi:hypothetical protein
MTLPTMKTGSRTVSLSWQTEEIRYGSTDVTDAQVRAFLARVDPAADPARPLTDDDFVACARDLFPDGPADDLPDGSPCQWRDTGEKYGLTEVVAAEVRRD